MSMNLAERLIHAREECNLANVAEVARRAGITPSALYQLENGQTKSLAGTTAAALAKVYAPFRAEWLISGNGPRREGEAIKVADVRDTHSQPDFGYVRLPLLDIKGGMGHGTYHDGPTEIVKFIDVAEWWATQFLPRDVARVKVIGSIGDSNAPLINDGDLVFIDTSTTYFAGEGLYVFNWNGHALIKRLAPNLRTGKLEIISANAEYPLQEVSAEEIDQLQISAKVLRWWSLRSY